MPWKVETLMSAREEFIALADSGAVSMSELCGRFTISRKTGYKWLRRYAQAGGQSLRDRSHRTHTCPHRTRPEMEERVVALRLAYPTKGAHVLARMLQDQGHTDVPAKSTITAILKRHGLIDVAQSVKHTPYVRFERPSPNELWQMDFKGHFVMHHDRCHPFTLPGRSFPLQPGVAGLCQRAGKHGPRPPHPRFSALRLASGHADGQRLPLG